MQVRLPARDVIEQPLAALGYTFRDANSILRILSYTGYHAGLLQIYGDALIQHLMNRVRAGEPPYYIEQQDVDQTYLRMKNMVVDRFKLTLRLNTYYRAIAMIFIWEQYESRTYATAYTANDVLRLGSEYWPAGFTRIDDEMINSFGADTVRLFMLFAAPPEKDLEWDDSAVEGASRYLNRVWRIVHKWHEKSAECGVRSAECEFTSDARALRRKTHQTIQRISDDIGRRMSFNTGVAALMELTNAIYDFDKKIDEANAGDLFALKEALESLVKMLAPYTPHIAEELWASLGHNDFVVIAPWPAFDAELAKADELEIPVQINGKMSGRVIVAAEIDEEALKQAVFNDEKIKAKIADRQIVKTIVVPKRLVNIVVK